MRHSAAFGLLLLLAAGALPAACSSSSGPGTGLYWTCAALSGKQYFQRYALSREIAFERAMDECKTRSKQPSECIGNPDHCTPPPG